MNGRKTVWCAAIGLLLSVALSRPAYGDRPWMRTATVIENFDDGSIELFSFPGEDFDPNGWSLDSVVTHNGSARSLKLTGNTWKVRRIAPSVIDSGEVWSVAANVMSLGEAQGFGIMDSLHSLFFSFEGSEMVDPDLWVTVDQGAFPLNSWHEYRLPIADEWLTRFGYLPVVTGIVFVNDRDTDPTSVIYFDDILDITEDLPSPPQVTITYVSGGVYLNPSRQRSVDIQFYSHVTDPDSGEHSYVWQFGDNSTSTLPNPAHTFLVEDDHEYTVVLEVSDQTGLRGQASVRVAIDHGPTTFPLRLNFVGDIMMARAYEAPGGIIPTQGVQAIFAPTLPYLGGNADITVANLECSLTTSTTRHPTKSIAFKGSPANVAGLVYAGIDVVNLANNHIIDYGLAGLQETQNVLRPNNIRFSGAGVNADEAYLPLFYSRSGVSFAFVAMSDRTGQYNNEQPYLNAGEDKPGFAFLTPFELQRQIGRVRGIADRVVVELHSGREYSTAPNRDDDKGDEDFSPTQRAPMESERSLRRMALDFGADLVVSHHPHITQGFEVYKGKLIAHSLGNFAFDLAYTETFPSMILEATVDARGFSGYAVAPVYIDHYIPRRARGQLGTHILDDLAMRSREMGTYLIVHPDSVRASIVLDTMMLWPRPTTVQRTIALSPSGSWSASKPERLARNGSIASIPSIDPPGTWQYRLGRDVMWFGNCEDEGCSLWRLDASDERYDSTVVHAGHRSLRHLRSTGTSTLSTSLESRIAPSTTPPGFSVFGWIKTSSAREATIRASLYNSRSGSEIGSGDIGTLVSGTTDWTFYSGDIVTPAGVTFADVFLESKGPTSGTGYSWFDDVGLIEWSDWMTYDGTGQCEYPNDYYWIEIRTSSPAASASVTYREVSFVDVSQPAAVTVSIRPGWNMISNPVTRPDSLTGVRSIFPNSLLDHVFSFTPGQGYVQSGSLENGAGYWGKFPYDESIMVSGALRLTDSIRVCTGWNIIGTISTTVDTATIVTIPSGLRSSLFFGYSEGYFPAAALVPGGAYWVKSIDSGMFVLRAGMSRVARDNTLPNGLCALVITGANRESRKVYYGEASPIPQSMMDLPPPPPDGVMDARFASHRVFAIADSAGASEWPIDVSSAAYPITVSWSPSQGTLRADLRLDDRVHSMRTPGSATVSSPASRISLILSRGPDLPRELALGQNYPNPFNPGTTISYSLPAPSAVSLKVFSITGQLVRTLVRGNQEAGRYSVSWDGTSDSKVSVSSGVYFYQLKAGPAVLTRKLLLLK